MMNQSRQTEREIIAFYDGMRHGATLAKCQAPGWSIVQLYAQIADDEQTELRLLNPSSILGETLQGSGETD